MLVRTMPTLSYLQRRQHFYILDSLSAVQKKLEECRCREWTSWSVCSSACGPGKVTRQCMDPSSIQRTKECEAALSETNTCVKNSCDSGTYIVRSHTISTPPTNLMANLFALLKAPTHHKESGHFTTVLYLPVSARVASPVSAVEGLLVSLECLVPAQKDEQLIWITPTGLNVSAKSKTKKY